jgi:hypothetical protein
MNIDSVKMVHSISDVLAGVCISLNYTTPKWFVCRLEKKKSELRPLSMIF